MTIDEIRDNFALLDEWDDRYRYVIELGRMLDPMPDAEHSAANKVQGCVSQVWLSKQIDRAAGAKPAPGNQVEPLLIVCQIACNESTHPVPPVLTWKRPTAVV